MESFIVLFENALSEKTCDHLIERFDGAAEKQPGRIGSGIDTSKKNSSDLFISGLDTWEGECRTINQAVFQALLAYCQRYPHMVTGALSPTIFDQVTQKNRALGPDDISRLSPEQLQSLASGIFRLDAINLQHYQRGVGNFGHWHSEQYPHPADPSQKSLHRVLLWLLYLNDVEEGGETEFFYQGVKLKPKKGSLVVAPCGFTHTHRGNIPRSGDKYVLTSWVLYRPAQELYS